jgi:predicted DNA-binding transcriptional regulator YafY
MNDRLKKTERMLKIWILLANNPPGYTAKELAGRCDVNERTIYRDLTALGTDINVPVYNDQKRWKIDQKFFLPPIRFTITEALNIFLTARLMLNYSHRYDPNVDATFTKLSSVLPPPLAEQVRKTMDWMQKLPKDEKYLRILATVAESWVSQRQLKIIYQSLAAEKPTERIIEPYYIEPASFGHTSYVIGYCHLKKEIRTFKVERIESANLTAEAYTIPSDFDANIYMASSWGIVVKDEIKTIKLKIVDPEIIRIMTETIWHPSQTIKKQKDGSTIMTLMINGTYEFYSWILGWGEKIEVLDPPEIRERIIKIVEAMGDVYKKSNKQVLT